MKKELTIYPNPLQGSHLSIESTIYFNNMVDVKITDMEGREVYSQPNYATGNKIELNPIDLTRGLFVVSIQYKQLRQSGVLIVY